MGLELAENPLSLFQLSHEVLPCNWNRGSDWGKMELRDAGCSGRSLPHACATRPPGSARGRPPARRLPRPTYAPPPGPHVHASPASRDARTACSALLARCSPAPSPAACSAPAAPPGAVVAQSRPHGPLLPSACHSCARPCAPPGPAPHRPAATSRSGPLARARLQPRASGSCARSRPDPAPHQRLGPLASLRRPPLATTLLLPKPPLSSAEPRAPSAVAPPNASSGACRRQLLPVCAEEKERERIGTGLCCRWE
jgi:hypothetical protein